MLDKQEGIITHIQKMSIHDGDGIRTTIFFKGCDLRCKWCHNPETFSIKPQLEWIQNKCIGCGICLEACPEKALTLVEGEICRDINLCSVCGTCASICYAESHHYIGQTYNVSKLCEMLEADRKVFEVSGGGVTISGGEPMVQYPFLKKLVKALKEKSFNIVIQTNMNSEWSKYEYLLPYIDYLMCDFKHIDSEAHYQWTGKNNIRIIENIKQLDRSGFPYCLRTPVIPGVNDSAEILAVMSDFVSTLRNIQKYELLPFHPLAAYKYKNLGMKYEFETVGEIPKDEFRQMKEMYEK